MARSVAEALAIAATFPDCAQFNPNFAPKNSRSKTIVTVSADMLKAEFVRNSRFLLTLCRDSR